MRIVRVYADRVLRQTTSKVDKMRFLTPAFATLFFAGSVLNFGCSTSTPSAQSPLNDQASNIPSTSPTQQPSPTPDSDQKVDNDGITAEEQKPLNELALRCKHAPVGKAKVTPLSGKAPLTVTFDGSSSYDPDGTSIVSWRWLFGNGESKNGRRVTYIYEKPGTYGLGLVVTDAQRQKNSDCGTGATDVRVTVFE